MSDHFSFFGALFLSDHASIQGRLSDMMRIPKHSTIFCTVIVFDAYKHRYTFALRSNQTYFNEISIIESARARRKFLRGRHDHYHNGVDLRTRLVSRFRCPLFHGDGARAAVLLSGAAPPGQAHEGMRLPGGSLSFRQKVIL